MKIKNPHYLIVGETYTIQHPVYDDYDEGLKPEIETVKVIKKLQFGYLVSNVDLNFNYELKFDILKECIIEKYD